MRLSLSVKSYIDFLRIFLEIQKSINLKRDIILKNFKKGSIFKDFVGIQGNLDFKFIQNYPSLLDFKVGNYFVSKVNVSSA